MQIKSQVFQIPWKGGLRLAAGKEKEEEEKKRSWNGKILTDESLAHHRFKEHKGTGGCRWEMALSQFQLEQ